MLVFAIRYTSVIWDTLEELLDVMFLPHLLGVVPRKKHI